MKILTVPTTTSARLTFKRQRIVCLSTNPVAKTSGRTNITIVFTGL